MASENQECSRTNSDSLRCFASAVNLVDIMIKKSKLEFGSRGLNHRTLKDSGDGTTAKYLQVLDKAQHLKSINGRMKITSHTIAMFKNTKRTGFSTPNWDFEMMEFILKFFLF